LLALAVTAALLSGCGGGGGSSRSILPSNQTGPSAATRVSVEIQIAVSTASTTSSTTRAPLYTSPAQQSITVTVYSESPYSDIPVEKVVQNLTPSSTGCGPAASGTPAYPGTVCNVALNLAPGNYAANLATFNGANGHGSLLSVQYNLYFTVPSNGNGNPTIIPWTLYGVPASLKITPLHNAWVRTTSSPTHFITYSGGQTQFSMAAYDASGAQIVGAGSPTWQVTSSNPELRGSILPTGTIAVSPVTVAPETTQLTITAQYPNDITPTQSSACHYASTSCTLTATVDSIDVQADDWDTFAHDYARTGTQLQQTGISTSTAANLALRWKVSIPAGSGSSEIYGNPAVYRGNVIVVTISPATVYDLSAVDGSVLWSYQMGGESVKPATIDGPNGLVFVGNRLVGQYGALPSNLYALHLSDGSVAWQTQLTGDTRSSEVVANGVVYVGSAGGDAPSGGFNPSAPEGCLNNGVQALNEANGAVMWTWLVNSVVNPYGGGAVWGAIAYDGSRLIFGTGNTCQTTTTTADGAVALDLNGHLLWSMVAYANSLVDWDTGSGTVIYNGNASFLSKTGALYTYGAASGSMVRNVTANPNTGYGFFASPTTDGKVMLVGAGWFPNSTTSSVKMVTSDAFCITYVNGKRKRLTSSPSFHNLLRAFDMNGNPLWQVQNNDTITGYAALNNGVAFVGLDDNLVALNEQTGAQLWSYPAPAEVEAGVAVVPSGVYAADANGNVYAFAMPLSTGTGTSSAARAPTPLDTPAIPAFMQPH
jgi:outer membrane protein assembly factor BamB